MVKLNSSVLGKQSLLLGMLQTESAPCTFHCSVRASDVILLGRLSELLLFFSDPEYKVGADEEQIHDDRIKDEHVESDPVVLERQHYTARLHAEKEILHE